MVYGDIVTNSEDLVGWWNFDQHVILPDAGSDYNASWTPASLAVPPVLWLDGNDSSSYDDVGGFVTEWRDQTDPTVFLEATNNNRRPKSGTIINGLGTIDFDVGHRLDSRTDSDPNSNPLGSGTLEDSALYIVYQLQSNGLRQYIFNNGANWRSHGPWTNGYVYWDVGSGTGYRIQAANWAVAGETLIGMWYASSSISVQQVWKNGKLYVADDSSDSPQSQGDFNLAKVI